jgi:hypothetical protein
MAQRHTCFGQEYHRAAKQITVAGIELMHMIKKDQMLSAHRRRLPSSSIPWGVNFHSSLLIFRLP